MSGNNLLVLLVMGLAAWLIYYYWTQYQYPQIACSKCHGAGWRRRWIFHLSSLRPRRVRGPCHRCGGNPWTDR